MNTSKQVNVMIGLMFLVLIGTLLYFIWDDVRADDAEQRQTVQNAERGGKLFSLNCRSCHGVNGLGTLENTLLPGLPLNLEANRPADPDTKLPDPGELMEIQSRFRDTIRCGRLGTLMPAWAEDQGGPLNDFQIDQLIALITGAMQGLDLPDNLNAVSEKGWEAAVEEAEHADLLRGKKLAEAVGAADTVFVLTDVKELNVDSLLRIDDEVVRIADISLDNDEITVERADFQTQAAEHEEGAQVFTGPIEPPTGPFIDVACGQTQRAPAPSGTPPPAATPAAGVTVDVGLVEFVVNPARDTADAGALTFSVSNDGAIIHNFRAIKTDLAPDALPTANAQADEAQLDVVASLPEFNAGETAEVSVDLEAGSYVLICNIPGHYDLGMRAAFTVE
jgi:uncharacterized cupredoxin-like copper-binding protein/mono/diheme cytochrome c family protein